LSSEPIWHTARSRRYILKHLTLGPGMMRNLAELILRRFYTSLLDSGVMCSSRPVDAVAILVRRAVGVALLLLLLLLLRRLRRRPSLIQ
jgi:hypothetical protein